MENEYIYCDRVKPVANDGEAGSDKEARETGIMPETVG
jgi:hypothetical protein